MRPVQVRKENYPYTYRIKNMDEEISVTVDRAWTPYNHLILDIIGHELFAKAYKHVDVKRNSWKNKVSQKLLMNVHGLKRYADRENIIKDELKPYIPKYKKYVYLDELCKEWRELERQNKLEEDKFELLEKYCHGEYLDCARYQFAHSLGISYLPKWLEPNDCRAIKGVRRSPIK